MAKDLFSEFTGAGSTAALARAITESARRMDEIVAGRVLHQPFTNSIASMQTVAQQIGTFAHLQMCRQALGVAAVPSSTAFMPSQTALSALGTTGFIEAAQSTTNAMRSLESARSLLRSSLASKAGLTVSGLNSLASAQAALRDPNHAIFSRSTEMFQAVAKGLEAFNALEAVRARDFHTVLQGVRLNQVKVTSAVEELASTTMPGLQSGEAHDVALAFEEAIEAQVKHVAVQARAGAEQSALMEGLLHGWEQRLSRQMAGDGSRINWNLLVVLAGLVIAILQYASQQQQLQLAREAPASDRANTEAITSKQDETNDLLRQFIGEYLRRATEPVLLVEIVDRSAAVYSRPRKGTAVIAVVPKGTQVVIVQTAKRWREVTYTDSRTGTTRVGWIMSKYLRQRT